MLQIKRNIPSAWWRVFKLLLTALALWFIYIKIRNNPGAVNYLDELRISLQQPGTIQLFILVFLLMILNWTVEAVKWRYMIRKIDNLSLLRSIEAIFSGVTFSLFTPNRIGEYAGRVFHLPQGKRLQGTFITIIENVSQLVITIVTGCIASLIFLKKFIELDQWVYNSIRILLIMIAVLSVFMFLNIDAFGRIFERFRKSERMKKIIDVFSMYSRIELTKVLFLSTLRYMVFSLQFYLLLRIYGCVLDPGEAFLMIVMTFFAMAIIPTIAIAELAVRGWTSTYFFEKITIDILPVLNATFSLWFINLVIPALAGALFINNFRLEKRT